MTKLPTAIIFGANGQDGSYLAELLLSKGYKVAGWVPDFPNLPLNNIQHLLDKITLVRGSLSDSSGLFACMEAVQPDEIYNLAAPSMPAQSWQESVVSGDVAGLGAARLLEAMRLVVPRAHFYQASSSEIFGTPVESPQCETTPFRPRNPYGVAKLYAHWMTINYRREHRLYAVAGILFNHESPRRGLSFVTRKVTNTAARIKCGLERKLSLGNLEARRDWGYAPDYVEAIWRLLNLEDPDELVIGTGETHSVRELCEVAFSALDMDYRQYVEIDPRFYRPPETAQLVANPEKAHRLLGWQSTTPFAEIVRCMVAADLELVQNEIAKGGQNTNSPLR